MTKEFDVDKYANFLLQKSLDEGGYSEDDRKLIEAVKNSNMPGSDKCKFSCMLMDYGTEKLHTKNLEKRLALSYSEDKNIEKFIDDIVWYSPKFGCVEIMAGESRTDETGNGTCHISIPTKTYFGAGEELRKEVDAIIDNVKRVLRIILVDAKKMRL
jgi:hypothetical protein